MSRLNEMRHGTPKDVMYHLNTSDCSPNELAAALLNAFGRIAELERLSLIERQATNVPRTQTAAEAVCDEVPGAG